MRVGQVETAEKVLIIAEIGNNHEGNFERAQELVRLASRAGADAVKFQTYRTEQFVRRSDEARFRRLSSFELGYPQFEQLASLARSLGLLFISTPLDLDSARFLEPIVDALKIASSDNTFIPLLEMAARSARPLIVSTGLADLGQIRAAVDIVLRERGPVRKDSVAVLHCVTAYPVPPEQVNLLSIPYLRDTLGLTVGYSDHTLGIEAAVAAVALGARIIEKHFTIDKHLSDFRDHQLSADPADLADLVKRVRQVEAMRGLPRKTVSAAEQEMAPLVRRSIAAARDLASGHRLAGGDFVWTRPGDGLAPGSEAMLIGKTLRRDVKLGEHLLPEDVK